MDEIVHKESITSKIITGIAISVGGTVITGVYGILKTLNSSIIDIGEWDNAYNNINKIIFKLDKNTFLKHRTPTTNKEFYKLCDNTSYFIRLKNKNYVKIETYRNVNDKSFYPEHRLKISFYGKEKYKHREEFLKHSNKLTDERHIRVTHFSEYDVNCNTIPHSFDNIVLDKNVKNRIIVGLKSWNDSKDWYLQHQLTHKIGVFLYGKPGTGKSTVAKAVSSMFKNAPILTVDVMNIMRSISSIIKMRNKYEGTIIVLIEDFDMYFKSREELDGIELVTEQKKQKDMNQNALFQLLDGVYSTDDTIYIATTNYKDRIDSALIRYGRFDIQEELDYFNKNDALKSVKLLGYNEKVLSTFDFDYPVQPSYLQSKIMEYRAMKLEFQGE